MELKVLGCQGGSAPGRHLPGLLLDGAVLLEAGSAASCLDLGNQLEIRHVLLTHAHLDHTGGIAYLADNRCCHRASTGNGQALTVCSVDPVLEDLRGHFFNDRIWPDFSAIATPRDPVVRFRTLQPDVPHAIGDRLTVIPVPVHHTVPTVGYIVHDDSSALVFSGDTGPTEQLWKVARELGNVRAIIVEASFPNRFDALAEVSGHLTPSRLAWELDKMPPCDVWAYLPHQAHVPRGDRRGSCPAGRASPRPERRRGPCSVIPALPSRMLRSRRRPRPRRCPPNRRRPQRRPATGQAARTLPKARQEHAGHPLHRARPRVPGPVLGAGRALRPADGRLTCPSST